MSSYKHTDFHPKLVIETSSDAPLTHFSFHWNTEYIQNTDFLKTCSVRSWVY